MRGADGGWEGLRVRGSGRVGTRSDGTRRSRKKITARSPPTFRIPFTAHLLPAAQSLSPIASAQFEPRQQKYRIPPLASPASPPPPASSRSRSKGQAPCRPRANTLPPEVPEAPRASVSDTPSAPPPCCSMTGYRSHPSPSWSVLASADSSPARGADRKNTSSDQHSKKKCRRACAQKIGAMNRQAHTSRSDDSQTDPSRAVRPAKAAHGAKYGNQRAAGHWPSA